MFIRFSDERKVEQKFFSEKIQQIAQNATNSSGLVAIRNSFTSGCSRGLHEIYRIVIVLTKAKPMGSWITFDSHFKVS